MLITHCIDPSTCVRRQSEFYHKCHRCVFRGKPVDFVPESAADKPAKRGA